MTPDKPDEPDEKAVPVPADPLQTAVARSFAACVACMGGAATFFLVSVTAWPLPLYQPLARRWVLSGAQRPLELSMDFYGRSLYALLGGALAGLLAYGYARWRLRRSQADPMTRPTPDATPDSLGGAQGTERARPSLEGAPSLWLPLLYAATAFAIATALFAYQLWGRVTFPESPPATSASPARVGPAGAAPTPAQEPSAHLSSKVEL